jgi:hypothetical protein
LRSLAKKKQKTKNKNNPGPAISLSAKYDQIPKIKYNILIRKNKLTTKVISGLLIIISKS